LILLIGKPGVKRKFSPSKSSAATRKYRKEIEIYVRLL